MWNLRPCLNGVALIDFFGKIWVLLTFKQIEIVDFFGKNWV